MDAPLLNSPPLTNSQFRTRETKVTRVNGPFRQHWGQVYSGFFEKVGQKPTTGLDLGLQATVLLLFKN